MLHILDLISLKDITGIQIIGISGGYVLNQLLACPGASKYISGIYYPYSKEHTLNFLSLTDQDVNIKFVSKELVHGILTASGNNTLVISAALPTNRIRRGNNEAFIGLRRNDQIEIYHLELQKEADEDIKDNYTLRLTYDNLISMIAIYLLLGEKEYYRDSRYVTNFKKVY